MLEAMILILGGPSGSGKSALGRFLQTHHGFVHIEFDLAREDVHPLDTLGARVEWNAFFNDGNAALLLEKLPKLCVITIPGFPWFTVTSPVAGSGVPIRYLVGPASICLREFERRERETGRGLSGQHWRMNNASIFLALELGDILPAWRVEAFDEKGARRTFEELVEEIIANS